MLKQGTISNGSHAYGVEHFMMFHGISKHYMNHHLYAVVSHYWLIKMKLKTFAVITPS